MVTTNMTALFTLFLLFFSVSARGRPFHSPSSLSKSFNVHSYGAKGDGKTDCTQSFLRAWEAACESQGDIQIYVPQGNYVLKHLTFEGTSCKFSRLTFQFDGTIVAPDDYIALSGAYSWIVFHEVNSLHIKGGTFDAKGKSLWSCKKDSSGQCPTGAKSLSFDNSKNIVVDGLTSINSQMFHITINQCENMRMHGMVITADANSPNTDGIHMEKSRNIEIINSDIQTGDDCISIGPDNQNIWIQNVRCGPGHGISIGSLGKGTDVDQVVSNVTVKSVTFTDTQNGLRIKTWAKPTQGRVQDIYFLDAHMNNVQNPIIIDQNYCPHGNCGSGDEASRIQIHNVKYQGIYGTSASPVALMFDCSYMKPCWGLTLQDIHLSYQSEAAKSQCKYAYGKSIGSVQPSSCLH